MIFPMERWIAALPKIKTPDMRQAYLANQLNISPPGSERPTGRLY
jgi:hypothetical protein